VELGKVVDGSAQAIDKIHLANLANLARVLISRHSNKK
jgi:hypothetical protein